MITSMAPISVPPRAPRARLRTSREFDWIATATMSDRDDRHRHLAACLAISSIMSRNPAKLRRVIAPDQHTMSADTLAAMAAVVAE